MSFVVSNPPVAPLKKPLELTGHLSAVYICLPLNAKSTNSSALVAGLAGAELSVQQQPNEDGEVRVLLRNLTIFRAQMPYVEVNMHIRYPHTPRSKVSRITAGTKLSLSLSLSAQQPNEDGEMRVL